VDADWRKGRVESPGFYTVVDVRTPLFRNSTTGLVTVFYRTNRYAVVDASDKVVADVPADSKTKSSRVDMTRINGVWKVADVALLR